MGGRLALCVRGVRSVSGVSICSVVLRFVFSCLFCVMLAA